MILVMKVADMIMETRAVTILAGGFLVTTAMDMETVVQEVLHQEVSLMRAQQVILLEVLVFSQRGVKPILHPQIHLQVPTNKLTLMAKLLLTMRIFGSGRD